MSKYLEHLLQDPKVYYVYQRGSFIYGTNTEKSKKDYLVIIDSDYTVPGIFKKFKVGKNHGTVRYNVRTDEETFMFYNIGEWFEMVLDCYIEPWECACLKKKYVLKEHVKLLMKTEPIKLRQYFQSRWDLVLPIAKKLINEQSFDKARKYLWYLIKDILFINQIVTNHKIIHYDEANAAFRTLINCPDEAIMEVFKNLIQYPKAQFYNQTNALVKQNHINKLYTFN